MAGEATTDTTTTTTTNTATTGSYTLPYTGDEVKQLLAKIDEQEQEIATLRDSISHEVISGWDVFKFNNNFAYATNTTTESISATTQYGSLYFVSYSFTVPDIFSSVLTANIDALTGNGLWYAVVHTIDDYPKFPCYLASATSLKSSIRIQKTVFGILK